MGDQTQLVQDLRDMKAQNDKAREERLAHEARLEEKIVALEQAVIDAGILSPEVDAAVADLKSSIKLDDDLVADAPVDTPVDPEIPVDPEPVDPEIPADPENPTT